MRILLTGGGTGGSVSPVLAVAEEIKKLKPNAEFLFIGSKKGPEKRMVAEEHIDFVAIPSAKWRRYFSIKNLFSPFFFFAGFIRAFSVVGKFKPNVVFTAGSFVGVPVVWVAKLRGAKVVVLQEDARIGLANKLVLPVTDQIATAFEETSKMFYSGSGLFSKKLQSPAEWVGNPFRKELLGNNVDAAKKFFHLHEDLPILLVLGGAMGAAQLNELVESNLPALVEAHQVIHQTGKGKDSIVFKHPNYHPIDLIPFKEYAGILHLAHIVVARAGLSTIAELSALGKVAVIIPMVRTHQEENAKILMDRNAAVVLTGEAASAEILAKVINSLKFNMKRDETMSKNIFELMPKDAGKRLAEIIIKHANGK
jgi:UDP-N-acetylglucosamine--N-acetylmuramyl-(pentapeptide) pyrophosphoryl-undecaprenol N-acetylglucosamine transferase